MKADATLDCIGLYCPIPIACVKCQKAVAKEATVCPQCGCELEWR
jgi:TusA-related sulfurtransferase